jgi:UDP-glucuronate 4-epimerase
MRILVTGAAGFIGFHLCQRLLARGDEVLGIDNLNDYYDVALKQARLERLRPLKGFSFQQIDVADRAAMGRLFPAGRFDAVMHLAAQAGVRYSLVNPLAYTDANLVGFSHVLEGCRQAKVGHLVFASSSSVYGADHRTPFSEHDTVDHPVSFYAATKRANELMAHACAHLYGVPMTGLRFFTVYGPWGRPDMAYFSFTANILAGTPIKVFNQGQLKRDFTYIDDIVEGVVRVIDSPPRPDPSRRLASPAVSTAPYRIYNIGNNRPVKLLAFIRLLEQLLGRKAVLEMLPMQAGDVYRTCADVTDLDHAVGFRPDTPIETGLARFVDWYRGYYRI